MPQVNFWKLKGTKLWYKLSYFIKKDLKEISCTLDFVLEAIDRLVVFILGKTFQRLRILSENKLQMNSTILSAENIISDC